MFDRLLGRAELRERIEELEAERDSLQQQLEAERERRAEASTARQEAERRANRLEDRIADLEGQLERVERSDGAAPGFRRTAALRGGRLRELLDRLGSVRTGPEGALTAMVADVDPDGPVSERFGDHAPLLDRAAPCLAYTDDAGLVSAALAPPLAPEPFVRWDDRFAIDRDWFLPGGEAGDRAFTLALVRADTFAVGRYEADERVDFEGFSTDIGENHSKGGFSQARFERLREEGIDEHLERCRETLAGYDGPLLLTGGRAVLDELADLGPAASRTVDATGSPEPALGDAFRQFWTTRLYAV
jgi:peptide subunit release factor 1 (eRF1)